jgi:hypothetical protein
MSIITFEFTFFIFLLSLSKSKVEKKNTLISMERIFSQFFHRLD